MQVVFQVDQLTVRLGDFFVGQPLLLESLSIVWLVMILSSILLIVLTGWSRVVFISMFVAAHLAMFLSMRLGIFPFISIAGLIPFLPSVFWDRAEELTRIYGLDGISKIIDKLALILPNWSYFSGFDGIQVKRAVSGLLVFILVAIFFWNAATYGLISTPNAVPFDPNERRWDMFAPQPINVEGWYVAEAELENNSSIDALNGGEPEWQPPPELASMYPSHRWYAYLKDMRLPSNQGLQRYFLIYLCQRWNDTHEINMDSIDLYFVDRIVEFSPEMNYSRDKLASHSCK